MNDVVAEGNLVHANASTGRPAVAASPSKALGGRVLAVVNLVAAFMATVSAILALVDPGMLLTGEVNAGTEFYAQLYAARSIPIGLAVFALFCVPAFRTRPAALLVLSVAGLAQVGDLAVAATQGIPGMMVGSAIGAIAHLASVAWLLRPPAASR